MPDHWKQRLEILAGSQAAAVDRAIAPSAPAANASPPTAVSAQEQFEHKWERSTKPALPYVCDKCNRPVAIVYDGICVDCRTMRDIETRRANEQASITEIERLIQEATACPPQTEPRRELLRRGLQIAEGMPVSSRPLKLIQTMRGLFNETPAENYAITTIEFVNRSVADLPDQQVTLFVLALKGNAAITWDLPNQRRLLAEELRLLLQPNEKHVARMVEREVPHAA